MEYTFTLFDMSTVGEELFRLLNPAPYKRRQRERTIRIEPDKHYSPSDVAAILNISYDSAGRLMQKIKGTIDLGTPTRRYKRGKKKLRVSGKNLMAFLRTKTPESLS
jgi:hypothetical protein